MRYFALLLIFTSALNAVAQTTPSSNIQRITGVSVEYQRTYNGKNSGEKLKLVADSKASTVKVGDEWIFVDYDSHKVFNLSILPSGDTIAMMHNFSLNNGLEPVGREMVAGWECTKYRTVINSNTIEIWATEDIGFNATFQPESGVPRGVVLKTVRNGNTIVEAVTVNRLTTPTSDISPASLGRIVDAKEYRHLLNNRDVVRVSIFHDISIGFNGAKGPASFANVSPDSVFAVAGGTVVMRRVRLPQNVDGRAIFARVVQRAQKDAYDRTGSIFIVPVSKEHSLLNAMVSGSSVAVLPQFIPQYNSKIQVKNRVSYPGLVSTANYDVPLELMRFFTSFGVGGYNHVRVHGQQWADSVVYHQEVTHLAPYLSGDVWIGAYIGNWVDLGHRLSLELAFHPSGGRGKDASKSVVMPLFNTVNLLEQAGQAYPVFFDNARLRVNFTLDHDLKDARLVYISTGHGGWGGGDEFNPRLNTIYLDKRVIYSYFPWRDDCASYRSLNPSSGNFSNGLSSSDLSRSAWCPGTITNPIYVPLGNLKQGTHTIEIAIPQGAPQGTSFNYWCVSGALTGRLEMTKTH